MKQGFQLVLALLLLFSCNSETASSITLVDRTYIEKEVLGREVQLIDVRTPKEYLDGHIDGAMNFNMKNRKTFLEQLDDLDKKKPVFLYCKKGGRSKKAAEILKKEGFLKIYDYTGGYDDWKLD